ncbi:MAG TPA: hypothetical protein VMV94_17335 [Phycisphaerae bacterium]|nr:hypothetical protein [Phycisphaerae bacterium]
MRYKTLFRLLLKVMGVFFVVHGATQLIAQSWPSLHFIVPTAGPYSPDPIMLYEVAWHIGSNGVQIAIGLYLFFGGKWIVNKAIRGNRPYCHECGYDLT